MSYSEILKINIKVTVSLVQQTYKQCHSRMLMKFNSLNITLRENTSFYVANGFLEAQRKYQTNYKWHCNFGAYVKNHCFTLVWQTSNEHYLKRFMDLNSTYQCWKSLNSFFGVQMH